MKLLSYLLILHPLEPMKAVYCVGTLRFCQQNLQNPDFVKLEKNLLLTGIRCDISSYVRPTTTQPNTLMQGLSYSISLIHFTLGLKECSSQLAHDIIPKLPPQSQLCLLSSSSCEVWSGCANLQLCCLVILDLENYHKQFTIYTLLACPILCTCLFNNLLLQAKEDLECTFSPKSGRQLPAFVSQMRRQKDQRQFNLGSTL